MEAEKPIIIVKKKGGHGGHHGGAWKVAYADFITALMSFFLVMWLVNSASTPTKERIASYFRRPGLFQEGSGTPLEIGGSGILDDAYVPSYPEEKANEVGESEMPRRKGFEEGRFPLTEENIEDLEYKEPPPPDALTSKEKQEGEELLKGTKQSPEESGEAVPKSGETKFPPSTEDGEIVDEFVIPFTPIPTPGATKESGTGPEIKSPKEFAAYIKEKMESSPELEKLLGTIEVAADANSINIEIMDTEKTSMFTSGSSYIREEARKALSEIGKALQRVRNKIEIVGHTDAQPFGSRTGSYSNWELSVDRANAARRILIGSGVDAGRIQGILGKADTELKNKSDPYAASNRRITLKMKFDSSIVLDPTPETKASKQDTNNVTELESPFTKREEEDEAAAAEEIKEPEVLERVPSLYSGNTSKGAGTKTNSKTPPETIGSPSGWKDPKFFGE